MSRYRKDVPGSHQAGHQGRLTGVYQNAIELDGGSLVSAGGVVTTIGLVAAVVAFYFLGDVIAWSYEEGHYGLFFWSIFCSSISCLIGAYFELFSPSEAPIYFDRLNRRVYFVEQGRQAALGLLDETDDLLLGVSALSHVRHSPS
ncbi:hypothetical protein [Variovorax boronicumulans]|uniref:hypothetical protein n=1 Tax=Variovorax boronicumulans TaxID=436515 RepID=UPI00247687CE|nr:hypothetical protein [Variovorax boronicumulans]